MKGTALGRGQVLALAAVVALVVTAVLFGARDSEEAPEPTAAPTPAPPAPAPPTPPPAQPPPPIEPEPNAGQLLLERYGFDDPEALGVRVDPADVPVDAAIDPGYDRLEDEGRPWLWPERFVTPTSASIAGEDFVEAVVVDRSPTPCHAFHRRVVAVDTGVPGPAGQRMAASLLEGLGPPAYGTLEYFDALTYGDDPLDDSWCLGVAEDEAAYQTGFLLDQVIRTDCSSPVREVRCFLVTRWSREAAMSPFWVAEVFVFDRGTGERLSGSALHPGLSRGEFIVLFRLVFHVITGFEVPDDVLDPDAEYGLEAGASFVPTAEGVAVEWFDFWAKRESSSGSRIVIPWEVIERAAAATS